LGGFVGRKKGEKKKKDSKNQPGRTDIFLNGPALDFCTGEGKKARQSRDDTLGDVVKQTNKKKRGRGEGGYICPVTGEAGERKKKRKKGEGTATIHPEERIGGRIFRCPQSPPDPLRKEGGKKEGRKGGGRREINPGCLRP